MSENRRTVEILHSNADGVRLPPSYRVGRNRVRFDDTVERFAAHRGQNDKRVRPGGEHKTTLSNNRRIVTRNRQTIVRFAPGIVRTPTMTRTIMRSRMSMRIPKMTMIAKMARMSVREMETLLSIRAGAEAA